MSQAAQTIKNLPAMRETWVQSLGWEDPLEEGWQPTPVFLPGESHGQRSLASYSPWGCKESDMTERQPSTAQVLLASLVYREDIAYTALLFAFFSQQWTMNNGLSCQEIKIMHYHFNRHILYHCLNVS